MKKILFIFSALMLIALSYGQNTVIRLALNDNEPYLNAGADLTITTLDSFLLSASTRNLDSLVWRTSGTGTITDSTAKRTYYTPSLEDYLLDSITVELIGYALNGQDTMYTEKILVIGLLGILNQYFLPIRTKANDIIYAKLN